MSDPIVELVTSLGRIEIQLDPDRAPTTVDNFLAYVQDGHYDGTIFHRVIAKFMVQGGGYDAQMEKKETRAPIKNEADNGLKNERGTVAMARRSEPHSATAQFFINVKHNTSLDHKDKTTSGWGYTVFGKVIAGMEIVDSIEAVATGAKGPFTKDAPTEDVLIQTARKL